MDAGKECPPQVICHMLPEQFGLHQCSVCSACMEVTMENRKTWCASVSLCVQKRFDDLLRESGALDSCHFGSSRHSDSLASFVLWTGCFCLYPRGTRHSTKSGSDPIAALLGSGIGTLLWPTGRARSRYVCPWC